MENLALIAVPLVVIALAMVFGYVVPTLRRRRTRGGPITVARFDARAVRGSVPPRPLAAESPVPASPAQSFAPAPAAAAPPPPRGDFLSVPTEAMDAIAEDARAVSGSLTPALERGRVLRMPVGGERGPHREEAHAGLRLERPADGTLQFLPGKLEVVEGRNMGQEIRFVRTAGVDGTSVTFGRSEGPPYRHVQLQEQTVSRHHARMSLDGKAWRLSNLSATNPVVVNGMALAEPDSAVTLRDGDRIELGEVVLRFRSK